MNSKTLFQLLIFVILVLISSSFYYFYFYQNKNLVNVIQEDITEQTIKSEIITNDKKNKYENVLSDINYKSSDKNGNLYNIFAKSGKISKDNPNLLILENVESLIIMFDESEITIYSKYAQYNSLTLDTKFSGDVKISFRENKLTAQNLDLIITENSVKIYNDVYFLNNNLESSTDRIRYDINTGDVVIDMFDKKNKINISKKNGIN
tara:strand:- start:51 stop:671 length:621 start_codon:yes stop_codon:yes gene_type:complete